MNKDLVNTDYRSVPDSIKIKGDPIWEKLFMVEIAQKFLFDEGELSNFGYLSTWDQDTDNQYLNSLTTVMLTIDQMVEHYKKGRNFYIVNHSDTKVIFDIIRDYLLEWSYKMDHSLNLSIAPVEDLVVLDKFAEKIYPHATNHEKPTDGLKNFITNLGGSMSTWLGRQSFDKTPKEPEQEHKPQKYNSISDILQEKAARKVRVIEPDKSSKNRWEV